MADDDGLPCRILPREVFYHAGLIQTSDHCLPGYYDSTESSVPHGEYLPSKQHRPPRFSVNRHTLRRAVDELVNKGLVQRRQGVGILVLKRPYDYPLHAHARFTQNLLEQGSHPTSERLLAVLRPASAEVAAALACEEGGLRLSTCARCAG